MSAQVIHIGPQDGPQKIFNATPADIAIYGGAAGGGKSWSLLYDPLRDMENPYFDGIIFRRTSLQIRNPGGLWDESLRLYSPLVTKKPSESFLKWTFPSGFSMKFAGLEYDSSVYGYDGSQIPYIAFDELIHFSEEQFWYMHSRNRSQSGVPGRIRAATNPDPDCWVRKFIDWWIGPDGYPIEERSGKLRWFIRQDNEIYWANSKEELYARFGKGPEILPQSVTFVPAKLEDNYILTQKDPAYRAKLAGMSKVEKERLLKGNWNIRPEGGSIFNRDNFEIINALPGNWRNCIRFWDKAGTKPNPHKPLPDWTRGLKLHQYDNGIWVIADVRSLQDKALKVNELILNVATQDGYYCKIMEQIDPGQAGLEEAANFVKMLNQFQVKTQPFYKDKATRARAVSAQCQAGNVKLLKGDWNEAFLKEVHAFKGLDSDQDDQVDALSGAYNELAGVPILDSATVNRVGRIMGGR